MKTEHKLKDIKFTLFKRSKNETFLFNDQSVINMLFYENKETIKQLNTKLNDLEKKYQDIESFKMSNCMNKCKEIIEQNVKLENSLKKEKYDNYQKFNYIADLEEKLNCLDNIRICEGNLYTKSIQNLNKNKYMNDKEYIEKLYDLKCIESELSLTIEELKNSYTKNSCLNDELYLLKQRILIIQKKDRINYKNIFVEMANKLQSILDNAWHIISNELDKTDTNLMGEIEIKINDYEDQTRILSELNDKKQKLKSKIVSIDQEKEKLFEDSNELLAKIKKVKQGNLKLKELVRSICKMESKSNHDLAMCHDSIKLGLEKEIFTENSVHCQTVITYDNNTNEIKHVKTKIHRRKRVKRDTKIKKLLENYDPELNQDPLPKLKNVRCPIVELPAL